MHNTPILRDIVLLGGGHAHAVVIRQWAMKPIPGVRMTLVSRDALTPYSGMLPGLLSEHYTAEDTHIDLPKLCQWADVRFIEAEVDGLDPNSQTISLKDHPVLSYDVVSLDTGSTPNLISVKGADKHTTPVKPVHQFYLRWQALVKRIETEQQAVDIAVVGAGAGGFELLLSMHHTLKQQTPDIEHRLHWIIRGSKILNGHNGKVQRLALKECAKKGINIHLDFDVKQVVANALLSEDGRELSTDEIIWCTDARGPDWLANSGLELDDKGFLAVNEYLQSESFDNVFAAGDIATQTQNPRPKAGVFAVRAGPFLSDNLQHYLLKQPLEAFNPQGKFLSILALGDRRAIASRGGLAASGKWVWKWKNHIDSSFMDKFNKLPPKLPMKVGSLAPALTENETETFEPNKMRCSGCGAKIAGDLLSRVVKKLNIIDRDDQLIGLESPDDAAIINPGTKLLAQSVDQLRSMTDDPYVFARIAANHALSDLYAMGATPQSAMAIVNLPFAAERIQERELTLIMEGITHELNKANCTLSGGHTAESSELSIGLAVNGLIDEPETLYKNGLEAGQALILTKPLGSGVILAAHMQTQCKGTVVRDCLNTMLQSNQDAAAIFKQFRASALTDITGFGLLGHLLEMLRPTGIGCQLSLDKLPLMTGVSELSEAGIQSTLYPKNHRFHEALEMEVDDTHPAYKLLFDPQTSGGLLAGVNSERADECVLALKAAGYGDACVVGLVSTDSGLTGRVSLD